MRVDELADRLGGKLFGDGSVEIRCVAGIEEAGEGSITYIADRKQESKINSSQASAYIVPEGVEVDTAPYIVASNPLFSFIDVVKLFNPPSPAMGILPGAFIGENVNTGKDITVYPNAYVGEGVVLGDRVVVYPGVYIGAGCVVGDDSIVYPNVVIMDGTRIGSRVIVQGGAVIGGDGYGFVWDGKEHRKIPQVGRVVIEDDVEIGSNSTIDKATLGETVICKGTKVDNLVHIAHNCKVGESVLLVGQAGMAGSVEVGSNVIIAAQAGVAGHLKIGDGAVVAAKAGITKDIKAGARISGFPPLPHMEWLRLQKSLVKVPEMRKTIKDLEERLKKLEKAEDNDV